MEALDVAGFHQRWFLNIACESAGAFVEGNHRPKGIMGFLVEIQNLLHPPHESGVVFGRDAHWRLR